MKSHNAKLFIILGIVSIILALLYTFTISHVDCNTITTWAYDLLESVRKGSPGEFPVYTFKTHNMATNYPLTSNALNAIWLLPVYIIDVLGGFGWSIIVYDAWYKVFILVMSIVSLLLMRKVLYKIGFSEDKVFIGLYLMASSSIILITVLGKGQIDIIDMFFVILSIYCYLNRKIWQSFLVIGVGCLFKPFIILLGVPYLLLMLKRCGLKSIFNGLCLVVPYMIDMILTRFIMPRYGEMKDITSLLFAEEFGHSRIEQIFMIRINSVLVFIAAALIICFICICLALRDKSDDKRLIIYPTLLFMAYGLFVEGTAVYWFACVLPIFIIMGLKFDRLNDFLLLNLGINLGVASFIISAERVYMPGKNYSVLDSIRKLNNPLEAFYDVEWIKNVYRMCVTVYFVCMILIVCIYIYEQKNNKHKPVSDKEIVCEDRISTVTGLLLILQSLVGVGYLATAYVIG